MKKIFKEISSTISVICSMDHVLHRFSNSLNAIPINIMTTNIIILFSNEKFETHINNSPYSPFREAINILNNKGFVKSNGFSLIIDLDKTGAITKSENIIINHNGDIHKNQSSFNVVIRLNSKLINVAIDELLELSNYIDMVTKNTNSVREKFIEYLGNSKVDGVIKPILTKEGAVIPYKKTAKRDHENFITINNDCLMASLFENNLDELPMDITFDEDNAEVVLTPVKFNKSDIEQDIIDNLLITDDFNPKESEINSFIKENMDIISPDFNTYKDPVKILHRMLDGVTFQVYEYNPKVGEDIFNAAVIGILNHNVSNNL